MKQARPHARRERLLVRSLADELLVYDLDRHAAVCLNRTAAAVWQHCDGDADVEAIGRAVAAEVEAPFDAQAVWCALDGLEKRGLIEPLEDTVARPTRSRREWLQELGRAGLSSVLIPAVLFVVAPSAAEAASFIATMDCEMLNYPDCGGAQCVSPSFGRCRPVPIGKSDMFQCGCALP